MNYVLRGAISALMQRLRSVRGWAVLLILPVLVLTVRLCLPVQEVSSPVQVGVALPETGAEEFWQLLESRSGAVLTFLVADEAAIERNVAAGQWDCGVVLAEDFAQRIEEGDTDKLFCLRISEGSAVHYLVQESVAACMAQVLAPQIGAQYLEKNGIVPEDALIQMEEVMADTNRVQVVMRTADGRQMDPLEIADSGVSRVLQWLVSAVVLVWMLLCGADLGRWGCSAAVRRMMPLCSATGLLLSHISADMLLGAVAAMVAMGIIGGGLMSWVAVVAYVLFLGGCGVLMARIGPVWKALPLLPPFLVVVSLLLSAVLVDMSEALPVLRWAPGHLFLEICQGSWICVLPLVGAGAVCVGISWILDRK